MKVINISGQEVTVNEMKVKDVRKLQKLVGDEKSEMSVFELVEKHILPSCVQGLKDIDELSISDAVKLWEAFKEVNQSFLQIARTLQSGNQEEIKRLLL